MIPDTQIACDLYSSVTDIVWLSIEEIDNRQYEQSDIKRNECRSSEMSVDIFREANNTRLDNEA